MNDSPEIAKQEREIVKQITSAFFNVEMLDKGIDALIIRLDSVLDRKPRLEPKPDNPEEKKDIPAVSPTSVKLIELNKRIYRLSELINLLESRL